MRADEAEVARVSLDKQVRRLNDELKRAQSRGLDADSDQGALLAQVPSPPSSPKKNPGVCIRKKGGKS